MRVLLDTCTFLWIYEAPEKVTPVVLEIFANRENEVYLSVLSAWEIALKHSLGRLPLPEPPDKFVPKQREAQGISTLAFGEQEALYLSRLPLVHKDPFDRMLICQAIVHGLAILTPDPLITQYPVRTIW